VRFGVTAALLGIGALPENALASREGTAWRLITALNWHVATRQAKQPAPRIRVLGTTSPGAN